MEIVKEESFLEWLAENYKNYGAELEFVTDKSSEGAQFVQGFGGIGAILRYKVNFEQLADESVRTNIMMMTMTVLFRLVCSLCFSFFIFVFTTCLAYFSFPLLSSTYIIIQ